MPVANYEVTRSELIALIGDAVIASRPRGDQASALLAVGETANRVAVGNFTRVDGVACPWTAAGLDPEYKPGGSFATFFDQAADAMMKKKGNPIAVYYVLAVAESE